MAGSLGKKIDKWVVLADNGKLNVTVYMGHGKHGTIQFTAICDDVSPRYQKTMDSIQELERDTKRELKQLVTMVWERRILVETAASKCLRDPEQSLSADARALMGCDEFRHEVASLEIDWRIIEVGVRRDGKECYRLGDKTAGRPSYIHDGLPSTCEFADKVEDPRFDSPGASRVLLPYTEENVAALTMLCTRLGNMAITVAQLLGPRLAPTSLIGVDTSVLKKLSLSGLATDAETTQAGEGVQTELQDVKGSLPKRRSRTRVGDTKK